MCVLPCLSESVRACVRACMPACMYAFMCVRAYVLFSCLFLLLFLLIRQICGFITIRYGFLDVADVTGNDRSLSLNAILRVSWSIVFPVIASNVSVN